MNIKLYMMFILCWMIFFARFANCCLFSLFLVASTVTGTKLLNDNNRGYNGPPSFPEPQVVQDAALVTVGAATCRTLLF
jgi:hypothetical protein